VNPDRRRQVEELFEAVLEHPPEVWDQVVGKVCEGDVTLAKDLRRLLAAHRRADGLLERPLDVESALEGEERHKEEQEAIGRFRILQEIGRGGMGKVFLAERADGQFRQRVALKILSEPDPDLQSRIVAERQILASLVHPNIGRLLDGGVTEDGRPYLIMEYVEGLPLDRYCDRMRLSIRERLRIFLVILKAVEHAHHNLVVHRDLKPSNILVTPSGEVKLLDFGIAKLLNPTLLGAEIPPTRAQDRALTPEYASPEQVRGEAITTAADVYSLGVLLYEILSGHRPYSLKGGDLQEMVKAVCEEDPLPPSHRQGSQETHSLLEGVLRDPDPVAIARARHTTTGRLRRQLDGDLDAIVMKALRKEPLRRYRSVELLSQDIHHFLDGLPVEARKGSRWYRLRKLARRHRGGVMAAALVAVSLVGGAGVANWQARVASREADRAQDALRESEAVTDFLLGLFEASDPWEDPGGEVTARDLLGRGVARANQLADEPSVQARMLEVMAEAYVNLGRYEEAETLERQVVQLLMKDRGEESPEVAGAMVEWGLALSRSGRYDSARVVLARAHEIHERIFGPETLQLSYTLEAQARVDVFLGDLEAAGEHAEESLALRKKFLGPEAIPTLNVMGVSASILRYQGRYEDAEARFRETLARRRDLPSPDPAMLSSDLLQVAGMAINYGGDLDEAEALTREALALQEPAPGRATVNRVWALTTLGQIMETKGDLPEAERLLRECVEERRRTFGNLHPLVAESLGTLGSFLRDQGRLDEAEAILRQAAEADLNTVGPLHTRYASSLTGLASILAREGKLLEADSLAREALEIRQQAQGPGAIAVAETLAVLADIRTRAGQLEDAEDLLLQAMEIADDRPAESELPRRIHRQLADLYEIMGRPEASARHRKRATEGS